MKIIEKILAFISLVIVLLSLSACKTKDNNNTGSGNNSGGVYEKGSYIQVVIKGELESQTQTDLFSALVYDLGLDVRSFFIHTTRIVAGTSVIVIFGLARGK